MKKLAGLVGLILVTIVATAQDFVKTGLQQSADVAFGSNGEHSIGSLSYWHSWGVGGEKKHFQLSYGLRFSFAGLNGAEFYSAPPAYYMIEEETDTLQLTTASQNNLVLALGATYQIRERFELGFNIDAVGYTFGATQTATFLGNGATVEDEVSPNQVTALLVGANDIGMVKSEFYVAYWLNEKWMLRAGTGGLFAEYKTSKELQEGNNRFRATTGVPSVAVRYRW